MIGMLRRADTEQEQACQRNILCTCRRRRCLGREANIDYFHQRLKNDLKWDAEGHVVEEKELAK